MLACQMIQYLIVCDHFVAEPKYADPIAGSSPSFQARLSELASLEAETVRYERLRKLKKKNREKDD